LQIEDADARCGYQQVSSVAQIKHLQHSNPHNVIVS
jgi:hypothetical protein